MTTPTNEEDNDRRKKLAYNIGGGVLGALLASVGIFGLVGQQSSQTQPQTYSQSIDYNQK